MKEPFFNVRKNEQGERLDKFLSLKFPIYSRNFIQKCIRRGLVAVNGRIVKRSSFVVKETDRIMFRQDEVSEEQDRLQPVKIKIDVVYEDRDILVVNKEPGLAVHPGAGSGNKTLINALLYKYSDLGSVGRKRRLGLVHRLDKETSGLVIVARNDEALWFFSRQFEEREVKKVYLVVVSGESRKAISGEGMVVSNYIGRSKRNRKKMAIVGRRDGKLATTKFSRIDSISHDRFGILSLVFAEPKTGRTHQIRVHLAGLGCPILGDRVYGGERYKRMMLHAYKLKVKMLSGIYKEFQSPVPRDFEEIFSDLNVDKAIL